MRGIAGFIDTTLTTPEKELRTAASRVGLVIAHRGRLSREEVLMSQVAVGAQRTEARHVPLFEQE